ncbi:EAL domain-containing protein [Trinickia terrae]|uniref:EAL domain-containing protein n=2 Tax=Trinickia terrae TaxID=2571161 RepID=A0A4U1I656_9BURK|nr:EAL domain-containing protein [Trinickia terrae]
MTNSVGSTREVRVPGTACDMAESERVQNTLVVGERQFRTLAEKLPNYLARYTPHAQCIYVNGSLARFLGYQPSQMIGFTPKQRFPDGRADEYEHRIRDAARTATEHESVLPVRMEDGQNRIYHVHFVPELDETGIVVSVLVIGYDITERRQVETERQAQYERILHLNACLEKQARELNEARSRMLSVLRTIPDMVWLKDTAGVYQACNHAFERLAGRPEAAILGNTDYDLFETALADLFRAKDRVAIEARRICISEKWVTFPGTGERALLETRKVPVFDTEGTLTGVLGVARDITERKRSEDFQASRERAFRTLVEHSPDVVMRYGKDLRRLYVNPTFAALIEGGAASVIGKKPTDLPGASHTTEYERKLVEVFTSGKDREFEVMWAHRTDSGTSCYLVKMTPEFGADGTVETVLAVGRNITELHASREKIHRMAFYDPLTSLPNRTLFNERLREAIADAVSSPCSLIGVMIIDMDRFKEVNDTMGHAVGDQLLREAAGRLRGCVRLDDTVARLGGDEFAILVPDVHDRRVLEDICKSIIDRFDERFVLNGKELFVSCSIGIALHPVDGLEVDDLTKYADSAMYLAKRSGRRGFRFYSKELTIDAAKRLALESELRRAIERGELELHYQPKVSLCSNEVIGSEALLRWHRPDVGLVLPNEFIPVAEETGLIAELGKWVLREASRTAAEWNAEGSALHKVAVNLSARQFQFHDLAATVHGILLETGCRPQWLELEITESLLLEEDDAVLSTLSVFRSMGFSIAIDDFGTGYSALSYLVRFPIDTVKIDRTFIQKVMTDRRHAELVKAILSIARCLGQQVVAEGIETVEQAAFLQANGCQLAQGFLYGRPLPKSGMASLPRYLNSH